MRINLLKGDAEKENKVSSQFHDKKAKVVT